VTLLLGGAVGAPDGGQGGGQGPVVPVAPPSAPPPLPERDSTPLRQLLTGGDGSVWELTGRTSGVQLKRGLRGLWFAPEEAYRDESPAAAGSQYRGSRTLEREAALRVGIYSDGSSADWYAHAAAFARALNPRREVVWTVISPSGTTRHLTMRFVPKDGGFDVDPGQAGWTLLDLEFVAAQPYWRGAPVVRPFEESAPQDFRAGPQRFISASNTLGRASITNPGDVPAYSLFTVEGPTTSVAVGVNGQVTEVPFVLPAGRSLAIDTSPTGQLAVDSAGVDRTAELGQVAFVPVPPGERVPLTLRMAGTGRVVISLTPEYDCAFA